MPNTKHLLKFAGKPVEDYHAGQSKIKPGSKVYRIRSEYRWGEVENTFLINFQSFLKQRDVGKATALVIGGWDGATDGGLPTAAVEQLVGVRDRLPKLKTLFFGDITYQEYEISWLRQGDVSSLFSAYPNLEEIAFRGGIGLHLGKVQHKRLQKLTIQAGGLPANLFRQVLEADLPALTHLELWLGRLDYGGNVTLEDLRPLLDGKCFTKMRSLGLRNRDRLAEIVVDVAKSPVVRRLDVLDLSMGSLNDEEAAPLLEIAALKKLKTLDLSQNYLTASMIKQFKKAGIKIKADDSRVAESYDDEEYRYSVIGEWRCSGWLAGILRAIALSIFSRQLQLLNFLLSTFFLTKNC